MRIACMFISHFPVAVERVHQPELQSQPVVIGGAPEERKIVVDCSIEAIQQGVRIGMPLREALSRCRQAAFLDAHHALYHEVAAAINRALGLISPLVEPADLGQVFVGLDGLERLAVALTPTLSQREQRVASPSGRGRRNEAEPCEGRRGNDPHPSPFPEREMGRVRDGSHGSLHGNAESMLARAIARAVKDAAQLTPKIGVADGKFAAFAAAVASHPDRPCLIVPGMAPRFLADLSVQYLPISQEMLRRLCLFGLRTLGQLAALPLGAVQAQFGPEGRLAWELANGIDAMPLIPREQPVTLAERLAFPSPISSIDALLMAAQHLIARATSRPEFERHAARGLNFKAMLTNCHVWERQIIFREPLTNRVRILAALRGKLEGISLSTTVEEIEVELVDVCGEGGIQGNLFASARGYELSRVDEVVRQLKSRYGRTLIAKVVEVEPWSRIPERRRALIDYDP